MSPIIIVLVVVVLLIVVGPHLWSPSIEREVQRAVQSGDLTPLLEVISNLKATAQPAAFNTAIRRLWDGYRREQAAALAIELVQRHPDERISHYWLDQVQSVEPEIAKRMLEPDFLQRYFRPEVAARCGSFG